MPILGFLKPMFLFSSKACLLYKRSTIVFWRFIFTFYYMGIPGVTRGYKELQGVTRSYRGLQGVTGGYKGLEEVTRGYWRLQGVTGCYKGLPGVTNNYRNVFLTRTFPDTFSWLILHKNRSWRNLKFFTKLMDLPLLKNSNFAFFINSCSYGL